VVHGISRSGSLRTATVRSYAVVPSPSGASVSGVIRCTDSRKSALLARLPNPLSESTRNEPSASAWVPEKPCTGWPGYGAGTAALPMVQWPLVSLPGT
jgi:hypothetical protein